MKSLTRLYILCKDESIGPIVPKTSADKILYKGMGKPRQLKEVKSVSVEIYCF